MKRAEINIHQIFSDNPERHGNVQITILQSKYPVFKIEMKKEDFYNAIFERKNQKCYVLEDE